MASLNLPSAIEALEQPLGLPTSVLQNSAQVIRDGGSQGLFELWETLQALSEKDKSLLKGALAALEEEENEDDQLRKHFQDRWLRAPSSQLNKNLKEMGKTFFEKMDAAGRSDASIKNRLDEQLPFLESLSGNKVCLGTCDSHVQQDLEASIPAATNTSTIGAKDPTIRVIRSLMDKLTINGNMLRQVETEVNTYSKSENIGGFFH